MHKKHSLRALNIKITIIVVLGLTKKQFTENLFLESVQIHVVRVVLLSFGRVVQVGFSNP
jgi:hypothetical protein